jgi:uncharacterized membrane protein YheB (UPF0754 family)
MAIQAKSKITMTAADKENFIHLLANQMATTMGDPNSPEVAQMRANIQKDIEAAVIPAIVTSLANSDATKQVTDQVVAQIMPTINQQLSGLNINAIVQGLSPQLVQAIVDKIDMDQVIKALVGSVDMGAIVKDALGNLDLKQVFTQMLCTSGSGTSSGQIRAQLCSATSSPTPAPANG